MHTRYVNAHQKLDKCYFAPTMAEIIVFYLEEDWNWDVALETKFLIFSSLSELALICVYTILFESDKQCNSYN